MAKYSYDATDTDLLYRSKKNPYGNVLTGGVILPITILKWKVCLGTIDFCNAFHRKEV